MKGLSFNFCLEVAFHIFFVKIHPYRYLNFVFFLWQFTHLIKTVWICVLCRWLLYYLVLLLILIIILELIHCFCRLFPICFQRIQFFLYRKSEYFFVFFSNFISLFNDICVGIANSIFQKRIPWLSLKNLSPFFPVFSITHDINIHHFSIFRPSNTNFKTFLFFEFYNFIILPKKQNILKEIFVFWVLFFFIFRWQLVL